MSQVFQATSFFWWRERKLNVHFNAFSIYFNPFQRDFIDIVESRFSGAAQRRVVQSAGG